MARHEFIRDLVVSVFDADDPHVQAVIGLTQHVKEFYSSGFALNAVAFHGVLPHSDYRHCRAAVYGLLCSMDYGYVRTCAVSPTLKVGDTRFNVERILVAAEEAVSGGASIVLFPELCLTGYTCADLFHQEALLRAAQEALLTLVESTASWTSLLVVGLPLAVDGRLWNCAAVIGSGKVFGVVPKSYLPNYKEYYEARWFSAASAEKDRVVNIGLHKVPFGPGLLFSARRPGGEPFTFAVEICEDLWVPLPPSTVQALRGAVLILNPSASTEIVAKYEYRRSLIADQSGRAVAAYLYAGAGVTESTTDVVFSGHCVASEYGTVIAESPRFSRETQLLFAEFDVGRLLGERRRLTTFADQAALVRSGAFGPVSTAEPIETPIAAWSPASFDRRTERLPFVPADDDRRDDRCHEIFSIQVAGLAKRVEHAAIKKLVIGVSGGLDSTLALLVAARTFDLLKMPRTSIAAVTMPGFGTTDATLANARTLMRTLGVDEREIDIREACRIHFRDIGHDSTIHDVTYENVQARERTQLLMDIANKSGGIVVGTGDLSEAALGWSTYNGDHMSMYAVNCSVPKTLVKHLVSWVARYEADIEAAAVLKAIIETPISPELLPPDANGDIRQKTEDIVGPYELHDFFLYHHARWGEAPEKIQFLATRAFVGVYSEETIRKWLALFYRRFFSQQFKRSCVPDGPKVGSICLSPRGDWRMPSDASADIWLASFT